MPEQRTDGHVTLLVAEYPGGQGAGAAGRAARVRPTGGAGARELLAQGGTDPGAEIELLGVALDKLSALRLIEVEDEAARDGIGSVIRSRPAIARFALAEPTIREPGSLPGGKTGTNQVRKAAADAASTIF
jgi:hypothetical protein